MTFQGLYRKREDEAILVGFKEGEKSYKEKLPSVESPHWKTKCIFFKNDSIDFVEEGT